jgi:hypothetical protein
VKRLEALVVLVAMVAVAVVVLVVVMILRTPATHSAVAAPYYIPPGPSIPIFSGLPSTPAP